MSRTMTATDRWEAAWNLYVNAIVAFQQSFPNRDRRGHRREHKSNAVRLRNSRQRLRKLDPEFCVRVGV